MKKTLFTLISVICMSHQYVTAQEVFSMHGQKPKSDTVWYYNVDKSTKPERMFCKEGGVQNFRLEVTGGWTQIGYIDDTITTNKKEWTEQDIKEAEAKFNEEQQALLKKMHENENGDRIESFDRTLEEEFADDCWDEFYKLLEKWDNEDFSLCIDDCKDPVEICVMFTFAERIEKAKLGYRFVHHRSNHSAENDDAAQPPYTVEISYSLEFYREAWVYFRIGCSCEDSGVMSDAPAVDEDAHRTAAGPPRNVMVGGKLNGPSVQDTIPSPWNLIDLTAERGKPGYPFTAPAKEPFPWVIASGSVAGVGTLIYFLFKNDDGPSDCAFTASAVAESATCDLPNGSITVTTSPVTDYAYTWSNGATTTSLSDLPSGNYSVTITRAGTSCSQILSSTVDNSNLVFDETITTNAAHCGESNGSATISITPAIPSLIYSWSNGGNGTVQTDLTPGDYSVTVSAGGTCTETYSLSITELPPAFDITILPTPASCGISDGSALAVVSPKGDYEFIWSDGQTGEALTDVPPGEYSVTVTLAGTTCQKVTSVVIGELPPAFVLSFNTTRAGCGEADGTAEVLVDPTGNYEFTWSNGMTTSLITDLAAGIYSVTATLAGTDCSVSNTVEIKEEPANFTIHFNTTPSSCNAADGTAEAVVEPPGNYVFLWSNGMTTQQITGLAPGQYSVTVTIPQSSCAMSASVNVEQVPVNFTISINTTPADCGVANGTATATVDPAGNYTYQWPNGSTEPSADGMLAGNYILTVTDENGCMSSGSFGITEEIADYFSTVNTVPGNCLGEGADIIIEIFTPGTGPMEITATGPDGVHVFTVPPGTVNFSTFFTVLPGAWQIIVRDMSIVATCLEEANVTVDDNTTISALDDNYETSTDQPVSGNVLTNDSGLHLVVQDYTFPSGGDLIMNADGSFTFTPPPGVTGPFSFQYLARDICGNTALATVTINVNSVDCLFDATFTTISAHCGLNDGAITTVLVPPGNYTFLWSNGMTTMDLVDIPAGQYSVTITSVSMFCDKVYSTTVDALVNTYISNVTTQPGNCTGEGNISMTLTTPGDGPLVVIVVGPEGTTQFTLPPGTHNLSSSMNIPSGDYQITVYDQGAGEQCSETIDVTVPDNTPALDPQDDFYETQSDMPVSGNVLTNDNGFNPSLTDVSQESGGIVTFSANGNFTYSPDPGFSGFGSFVYTVTDACGNTATAFVEILVEAAMCDFTVQFINTNASCGLEDGIASAIVDPPGTYFYEWSNGDFGATIEDIPAGMYTVTIEDVNLGCSLEFDTEVGENPAEYISNIQIIQPACPSMGDIRFEVSSSTGGPFEITVTHPNGVDVFTVPEGLVLLADHISLTNGDYTIEVSDVNAGPSCIDAFDATLEGGSLLEIMVEAIIPPSEPTSMDGAIVVVITMPTDAPYTIFLNGDFWGTTTETTFTIEGLGAGDYTVQIQDVNGCLSNVLNVTVPLPGSLQLEVGFGLIMMNGQPNSFPEQASFEKSSLITSVVEVGLHHRAGGIKQYSGVAMYRDRSRVGAQLGDDGMVYRISQMVEVWEGEYEGFGFKVYGGLNVDVLRNKATSLHWVVSGAVSKRIGKCTRLATDVRIQAAQRKISPLIGLGIKFEIGKLMIRVCR